VAKYAKIDSPQGITGLKYAVNGWYSSRQPEIVEKYRAEMAKYFNRNTKLTNKININKGG